jgi:hypothetical protein
MEKHKEQCEAYKKVKEMKDKKEDRRKIKNKKIGDASLSGIMQNGENNLVILKPNKWNSIWRSKSVYCDFLLLLLLLHILMYFLANEQRNITQGNIVYYMLDRSLDAVFLLIIWSVINISLILFGLIFLKELHLYDSTIAQKYCIFKFCKTFKGDEIESVAYDNITDCWRISIKAKGFLYKLFLIRQWNKTKNKYLYLSNILPMTKSYFFNKKTVMISDEKRFSEILQQAIKNMPKQNAGI